WAVGSGLWAVGSGQWAVGSGQWAVGSGQWAVGVLNIGLKGFFCPAFALYLLPTNPLRKPLLKKK
ncbi:MAG TPA: hypothetical protein VGO68_03120, partial [Pyrinomonadaceae bacterium]|nr:hypothetical protein [Pyrinomonadaceae bacterium]